MRSKPLLLITIAALGGCATDGGWRSLPPGAPAVVPFDRPRAPARAAAPPSGTVAATLPEDDEAQFATEGWRKPQMKVAHCVEDRVVVPAEYRGWVKCRVLVKFAVLRSGEPTHYSVHTEGVPEPIAAAIWSGIQSCPWVPGEDPQGRPANIWVILPLRFCLESSDGACADDSDGTCADD